MAKSYYLLFVTAFASVFLVLSANRSANHPYGLTNGNPGIQSINALAFGPDGILFIGDSKSAVVFAIDTRDKVNVDKASPVEIKNFDEKIAAFLGTVPKNITIQDVVVNPVSKKIYCALHAQDGSPVLLTLEGEKVESVNLKNIPYSKVELQDAPAEDAKDTRGRPLRMWAISDLAYDDGNLLVTGLSNREFSSTFRKIPFPFMNVQDQASLEIFHAAHGRFETYAPIKTFTTAWLSGKKYLVASFTCTPLVLFPMDELQPGKHVKGRTVGEFGSGNSPLDIVTLKKGNDSMLLLANSNRPVMKVKYAALENYEGSLTEPVTESYATAGVDFVTLPVVNVLHLDKLDDQQVVVLQRKVNGDLDLWTAGERWF